MKKRIILLLIIGILMLSLGCKKAEVKKKEIRKNNSRVLINSQKDQRELTEEVEKY